MPSSDSSMDSQAGSQAAGKSHDEHTGMANALRMLAADAVEKANSGHPGMPMGTADIATVLFSQFLKYDPTHPDWPDRDRFVLSAGHGSMLLYALLHLTGYEDITIDEIKNFRQLGSRTAGHPEYGAAAGIETTTGPLGQGLATAVGMAMAERHLAAEFGADVVNHRTYVLASDGDLMEGISHEAISLAGHLKLSKLIVLYDDNSISIDGDLSKSETGDALARFQAANWNATRIDGHDPDAIAAAIRTAQTSDRPTMIACKTTIGFGAPTKAGKASSHGSPLGAEELAGAREALNWPYPPFEIPADIRDAWRLSGVRHARHFKAWEKRIEAMDATLRGEFTRRMRGDLPPALDVALAAFKAAEIDAPKPAATRKSSEAVLGAVNPVVPEMVGGSADLTGSNNTLTPDMGIVTPDDFSGRYIHYGIREHGMAAAMNGMALHGGIIPYGGTFLIFSDYCSNAIRLSALQKTRVIYVMTHDSIGLGEDGPTHQPIEQVMSLRLIPNLNVFRPADIIETAECWNLALSTPETPSVLCLSRQNLKQVRDSGEMLSGKGAYRLKAAGADRKVVIVATGSEVEVALACADALEAQGIGSDVVSMPCMELFEAQDAAYKADLLPADALKVSIEAGASLGWERHVGSDGLVIGIDRFGASAPAKLLFEKFGFTADAIVPQIIQKIKN